MEKSVGGDPFNYRRPYRSVRNSIGADPWNLQPLQKRSIPSSNNLRFDIKSAALRASASVVGILTHLGDKKIFRCSGVVVDCKGCDGRFVNTILTSATILRPEPLIDELVQDVEITVILNNDISCKGVVSAYNFHYNIGIIEFGTDFPLETAKLRCIDDAISIDPILLDDKNQHLSDKYNLVPGDTVVALGRYSIHKNRLMVVAGEFSINEIELDCKELLKANLKIPRNGIGGPLINGYGEVIGINFFCASFTPFLPINIVSMWWEQLKKNSHHLVPRLQMQLTNLYRWAPCYLENVLQRFPNIFKGVVINKIISQSPAFATVSGCDIIVKCGERPVGSILELFELIWNKVGEPVDLTVLRPSDGSHRHVTMTVDPAEPNQINRWPLPKKLPFKRRRC